MVVINLLMISSIAKYNMAAYSTNWIPNGIAISTAGGAQTYPEICSDGDGGAIITWGDDRGDDQDIYAQRINASGNTLWIDNGTAICKAIDDQYSVKICSDNLGGAIIVWSDSRGPNRDLYAQRIDASGNVLWMDNGTVICNATDDQSGAVICSDNAGGAIIVWRDNRAFNEDIYAQRIDASGNVLWKKNGEVICNDTSVQWNPQLCIDEMGGAIITWSDDRGDDIYAQRIDSNGITLWTGNGTVICNATGGQSVPTICSDNAWGAIITWIDNRDPNRDIYAQRIDSNGMTLWINNGIGICTESNDQEYPKICSGGTEGAIIAWLDHRNTWGYETIYAQKVDNNGAVKWTIDGISVSGESAYYIGSSIAWSHWLEDICCDGVGGAVITWNADAGTFPPMDYVHTQRIDSSGTRKWSSGGIKLSSFMNNQDSPRISGNVTDGFIITWDDARSGYDIYAQRIITDDDKQETLIPGFSLFGVLGIVCVITIILVKKRWKLTK